MTWIASVSDIISMKLKKFLSILLSCAAVICSGSFLSHVHISHGGILFKIGAAFIVLLGLWLFISLSVDHDELSKRKAEDKGNFKLLFSRNLSSIPTADDILARLSLDYGLPDSEVERIARDGVHEAVARYRKSHPLDHPPSDDIDFINVFPGPSA